MTHPLSTLAAEIREAHAELSDAEEAGDFEECDFHVQAEMLGLAQKMDAWATTLARFVGALK